MIIMVIIVWFILVSWCLGCSSRGIRWFAPRRKTTYDDHEFLKASCKASHWEPIWLGASQMGMMVKSAHLHQLRQFNSSTVGRFFHTSSYWATSILEHHNSCECSLNDLLDARISIGPSAISPVQSWWVASEFLTTQVLPTKSRDFPRRSWRCYGQMRSFISGISPGTGSFNKFQQFLHLENSTTKRKDFDQEFELFNHQNGEGNRPELTWQWNRKAWNARDFAATHVEI
jgi:hypothetical protein